MRVVVAKSYPLGAGAAENVVHVPCGQYSASLETWKHGSMH